MIKMKTGLILLCLKNGYLGWHSCKNGFQLSSGEKKTEEAQIKTNDSRKHRTSVLVRT